MIQESKRQGKELQDLVLTRLSYIPYVNNAFLLLWRHLTCEDHQWLVLFQCYFSFLFESSGVLPRLLAILPKELCFQSRLARLS